jgi:hypothetical protein
MAALLVDPNPPGLVRTLGVALNQEEGAFANTDYHRLSMSSSNQNFVDALYVGGVSEFYLERTAAIAAGRVSSLVMSWGRRDGSERAYLFENGKQIEIDTSFDLPVATAPTEYQIGFRNVNSSALAHKIQAVIIGRNFITRNECRWFSNWLKKQALDTTS